jgi:hypothetical protein
LNAGEILHDEGEFMAGLQHQPNATPALKPLLARDAEQKPQTKNFCAENGGRKCRTQRKSRRPIDPKSFRSNR